MRSATWIKSFALQASRTALDSSGCLLWHLAGAFLDGLEGNAIKEENVRWIFDELGAGGTSIRFSVQGKGTHCRSCHCFIICSGNYICCSRGNWPFKLVVSVEPPKKEYRYTPRSDFHVSVDQLIYLLVEVQSERDQSDRYRMLLQVSDLA